MPDELTIELHLPRRGRLFLAWLPIGFLGALAAIIALHTLETIVVGGLAVLVFGFALLEIAAAWRITGTLTPTIVANAEGLSTPLWHVAWRDVDGLWLGVARKHRMLVVCPRSVGSVVRPRPRIIRLAARLDAKVTHARIRILQVSVDQPLETIAADFERLAGRPLLAR